MANKLFSATAGILIMGLSLTACPKPKGEVAPGATVPGTPTTFVPTNWNQTLGRITQVGTSGTDRANQVKVNGLWKKIDYSWAECKVGNYVEVMYSQKNNTSGPDIIGRFCRKAVNGS